MHNERVVLFSARGCRMGESFAPLTRSCGRGISFCLCLGVPCVGGRVHHRTISPICESGSGKHILQCMAARAGRRSRKSRIMVGETTDENSLLLILCMSQRLNTGSPKPTRFRRRFAYFLAEEKVGRRRPTPAIVQIVLPCRTAARHNLS